MVGADGRWVRRFTYFFGDGHLRQGVAAADFWVPARVHYSWSRMGSLATWSVIARPARGLAMKYPGRPS